MTIGQALLLGIVQGLTEFLPISSSGHLVLFGSLFGYNDSDKVLFFVLLHFATLSSVLLYFHRDILRLRVKELTILSVGTLPAVVIGATFRSLVESLFVLPALVGASLIVTGLINISADKLIKIVETKKLNRSFPSWRQALVIGLAQAVAITPGISRSGLTVAAGLSQGLPKQRAFTFSFLLSIPAILGAMVLELFQYFQTNQPVSVTTAECIGMIAAFLAGLLSLRVFSMVVKMARLSWFGFYAIVLGSAALITITFVQ